MLHQSQRWWLKVTLCAVFFAVTYAQHGFGADNFKDESDEEEYSFSWLDPDKKIYVLQNRKYRKADRLVGTLSGGLNLTNPYRSELLFTPRVSFWFNEQFGIEALYSFLTNSENDTMKALKNASPTALPFVRENRNYFAGLLNWSPWYAKINVFNKILYFDWFFNIGLGQLATRVDQNRQASGSPKYVNENIFAFFIGTGQNFFVTRHVLVRLDLTGMIFRAKGSDNLSTRTTSNFDFAAGLGYAF